MMALVTDQIRRVTGASTCSEMEVIQSLWSGYGEIHSSSERLAREVTER